MSVIADSAPAAPSDPIRVVNLAEAFGRFTGTGSPKIADDLNGQQVKLARIEGAFIWHAHADEDELFLVVEGGFRMDLREPGGAERSVEVAAGEFVIVPRGVEHRPVAERPASILLFEPATTHHTGGVDSPRTVHVLDRL